MRIVCPIIGGSGVEVYHRRLASGLAGLGADMQVVKFDPRWEYCPWAMKWRVLSALTAGLKAHILHTNAEYGNYFRQNRCPWVVTLHHCSVDVGYDSFLTRGARIHHRLFLRPSVKKSLQSADRAVAVSEHTRQAIQQAFQQEFPIRVIHNGIDPAVFSPRETEPSKGRRPMILFFSGNAGPRKGFDLLGPVLKKLGMDFVLHYTAGLRGIFPGAGLPPNARCLGRLSEDELVREINRADIVLQPSRREGFGYSILEGMACGKPVISTHSSSIPELVHHGKGGYLCETGSVDPLVDAIRELAQSPEKRRQMGQYNRQQVLSHFTIERMAQEYYELYAELL